MYIVIHVVAASVSPELFLRRGARDLRYCNSAVSVSTIANSRLKPSGYFNYLMLAPDHSLLPHRVTRISCPMRPAVPHVSCVGQDSKYVGASVRCSFNSN